LHGVVDSIEAAAEARAQDEADRLAFDDVSVARTGRPPSTAWITAADAAAVCLAHGVTPSEASSDFMRVIQAVWSSWGRTAAPTHAIRVMRARLRGDLGGGRTYDLHLPGRDCAYVMSLDVAGKLTSKRMTRGDFIKQKIDAVRVDLLAPENTPTKSE
jgi:hypothetical protein